MKELLNILEAYEQAKKSGVKSALATIMKVKGSTFRRPGARMLVTENGTMVGSISGGCLEADVFEKAKKLMLTGEAITAVYDMTAEDEVAWGLNQGCNGIIHLLLEPLEEKRSESYLRFLRTCIREQKAGAIATIFRVDGELKAAVGSRLMLQENGTASENIKNPVLSAALLKDAQTVLESSKSIIKEYRLTEGVTEAFIEAVHPPVPLYIFGAGSDAIPVARFANELGWNVTIVDHRPAFATAERFAFPASIILARPEEIGTKISFTPHSIALVMTHNFTHDFELLKTLLPSPVRYVGLLGPKKRADLLLQKLRRDGFVPTKGQFARLYNPVGLNIGAESPEEIALSILSEIQAVLTQSWGGFLRDHTGPIHGQSS